MFRDDVFDDALGRVKRRKVIEATDGADDEDVGENTGTDYSKNLRRTDKAADEDVGEDTGNDYSRVSEATDKAETVDDGDDESDRGWGCRRSRCVFYRCGLGSRQ